MNADEEFEKLVGREELLRHAEQMAEAVVRFRQKLMDAGLEHLFASELTLIYLRGLMCPEAHGEDDED